MKEFRDFESPLIEEKFFFQTQGSSANLFVFFKNIVKNRFLKAIGFPDGSGEMRGPGIKLQVVNSSRKGIQKT